MTSGLRLKIAAMFVLVTAWYGNGYASAIGKEKYKDSDVLRAALANLAALAGGKYFVVASEPHAEGLENDWIVTHLATANKGDLAPGVSQMVADYEKRNARKKLSVTLSGPAFKSADSKMLNKIFQGDVIGGWKRFREKFPDSAGLLDLSVPGYSRDRKRAIVCYSVSRGSLAGEVWVVLLHYKSDSWIVEWKDILVQS
jgi:hypothetical protein